MACTHRHPIHKRRSGNLCVAVEGGHISHAGRLGAEGEFEPFNPRQRLATVEKAAHRDGGRGREIGGRAARRRSVGAARGKPHAQITAAVSADKAQRHAGDLAVHIARDKDLQ